MALRFNYNVSRPYPIRFFTPFVIVFFLLATALLTLLNTIIDGYDLRYLPETGPPLLVDDELTTEAFRTLPIRTRLRHRRCGMIGQASVASRKSVKLSYMSTMVV